MMVGRALDRDLGEIALPSGMASAGFWVGLLGLGRFILNSQHTYNQTTKWTH